jgi:uncharacterized cofD-like protein
MWLFPGIHIKRWLLLLTFGVATIGLGLGYILRNIYYTWDFPQAIYYLTLQFLPRWWRALLFGLGGGGLVAYSVFKLNQSILEAFRAPGQSSLAEVVHDRWQRGRGPKVVAIGGGTGLSTLLRGLKEHTSNITAIVTVADDGGSSGRLRQELGVLPPGDIRSCIVALADEESTITKLFQYRFQEGSELNGHSFGNLFIAAMAGVTGNFERAVLESSRVLAVEGRILPSTLSSVTLCADLRKEVWAEEGAQALQVKGESQIPEARLPIERVHLEPEGAPACWDAVAALQEADLILLGPGSLYTSIMPNLLVEDITRALKASSALKVYICNVATQLGETEGYSVADHVQALETHIGPEGFDLVLANGNLELGFPPEWTIGPVALDDEALPPHYELATADLIDGERPWRHDPAKLADSVMELYRAHEEKRW